jgi:hypothetical protein
VHHSKGIEDAKLKENNRKAISELARQAHHLSSTCIYMPSKSCTNTDLSDKSSPIATILRRENCSINVASSSLFESSMLKWFKPILSDDAGAMPVPSQVFVAT